MNQLQRDGAVLCHAAGLAINGRGMGLAGFSGGGKSTLMLRLLAQQRTTYLSNDRLMLVGEGATLMATGIPKLPRVNPGTIVNDPVLAPMLGNAEADAYRALPQAQLWAVEHKYDVDVLALYGEGKITAQAPLALFIILNWQRDSDSAFQLERVDLRERPDLLQAVMKSPGPFYQDARGVMWDDKQSIDAQPYIDKLGTLPIYEARGTVDFEQASKACLQAASRGTLSLGTSIL
jgi:HprK-related kinase B